MLRGLKGMLAYMKASVRANEVTVPPTVDVKSIRKGLKMTQAKFSDSFGVSLDTVKHWEGGRTPEVPSRAYLTVIQRNPAAVLEDLHPVPEAALRCNA
jgi:putative transcriptional regulator